MIESPVGPLTAVSTDGVLSGLYMADAAHLPATFGEPWTQPTGQPGVDQPGVDQPGADQRGADQLEAELAEYFAGERTVFTVPTAAVGTPFQLRVWEQLAEIPYGTTRSYLDLALALGDARLVRAVGAANGRNPLSIVVPCHRVVGSDGTLTGYAGGVARKELLLALEDPRRRADTLF
nr:methylated-DNA--[protein]-cysteine S-methyltransferase [Sanguibacter keddieii]